MGTRSILVGALGIAVTRALVAYLSRQTPPRKPVWYWLLGLAGLLPAWLVAFLGLLKTAPAAGRPDLSSSVSWIVSSAAALLGLILSDAGLRRLHETGGAHRPWMYWLVGLLAFLPAWGIALLGLAMNRLGK